MSSLINEKTIKINEKEFKLKFNFKTMMIFEKKSNKKFFSFIDSLAAKDEKINPLEKVSAEDLAILFYSFLVGGGNTIEFEEAIDLLNLDVFNEFMLLIPQLIAGETKEVSKTNKEMKGEKRPLE